MKNSHPLLLHSGAVTEKKNNISISRLAQILALTHQTEQFHVGRVLILSSSNNQHTLPQWFQICGTWTTAGPRPPWASSGVTDCICHISGHIFCLFIIYVLESSAGFRFSSWFQLEFSAEVPTCLVLSTSRSLGLESERLRPKTGPPIHSFCLHTCLF